MPVHDDLLFGIGTEPRSKWPTVEVTGGQTAIDVLKPKSDIHDHVLQYLLKRLRDSEDEMGKFYARWQVNEKKVQAYVDLPNWEKILKESNNKGVPPKVTSIVIPYSYAIVSTIVTWLLHAFAGRKPIFQVGMHKGEIVNAAQNMEKVMQYNADHTRYVRVLFDLLQNSQLYGVGVTRSTWVEERAFRTTTKKSSQLDLMGEPTEGERTDSTRTKRLVYEGNIAFSQDPFLFFPDPRVPMAEVNKRGEFVFWRSFEGRHTLLKQEADGIYKYVKTVKREAPTPNDSSDWGQSLRSQVAGGTSNPGSNDSRSGRQSGNFVQIDQCTIDIIPRQLGIGEKDEVERWMFTIANKDQIIQAEVFEADHGMHPVQVAEPYSLGNGFGHLGIVDYMSPLQDLISWLFNSHMDNVRRVINDTLVVDPMAIEMQDLRKPGAGRIIRLKRAAANRDVRTIIQQLEVIDVTKSHISDAQALIRIGQMLSAVTDNVLGLQDEASRKTATEVRTSGQAAASRLANQSKIISSQSMVDTAETWALNIQQNISDEFAFAILGEDGKELKITPDQLNGDFNFPIHDGTLPLDRLALMDVWQQMFTVALSDQEVRDHLQIPKMFDFIAELGGAENIQAFTIDIQPDEQVNAAAQAGNLTSIGSPGLSENPAQSAAGAQQ